MKFPDISGFWTGEIFGTNRGGLTLELQQQGETITGIAKLHEPLLGQYAYKITSSTVTAEGVLLKLVPIAQVGGLELGLAEALCALQSDGTIAGRWKTSIGTEGAFTARRFDKKLSPALPESNSVFVVHGHDDGAKHSVARFLEQIGVKPVILQEQISGGMVVIEKFEEFASRAGFAVILMTQDDVGYPKAKEDAKKYRPRQNVVLEFGYFAAKLGRSKIFVLMKGDVEIPSDLFGIIPERMDTGEGWKMRLARELKTAGFSIDLNKAT